MKTGSLTARRPQPLVIAGLVVLAMLLLSPAAHATVSASPVTWVPAESTYGSGATPFVVVPSPALPGTGATSLDAGAAFGAGFWDACSGVYAMGFMISVPTSGALPGVAQTELSSTPLAAGVPLTLAFDKTPGQRVNFVAILGDPNELVSIEPADSALLTAAGRFTVRATVTDPVPSRSGDAGAAFGLVVDCSTDPARDYQNSLFVTDMHWLDLDPPRFTASGMAGLTAHGSPGSVATFDGIFTPAFLAAMGIADPSQVQGYVDVTPVAAWPLATFAVLGEGDGSFWPAGSWKYRVTNGTWCTHAIMYGDLSSPTKPDVVGPKGAITTVRPTFKWRGAALASTYEVRIYRGGARLLMRKASVGALQWRPGSALPKGVWLICKVRGRNAAGLGAWDAGPWFKIR